MGKCLAKLRKKPKPPPPSHPIDILTIPSKIREKIWRFLDHRTRNVLRMCCSTLKTEIDFGTGLKVRLDDSRGNLRFVKSVEVDHAVIVRLKQFPSPRRLFRCTQNVLTLEPRCVVSQEMYRKLVAPMAETLVVLNFSGSSLMHRSILPFEAASKVSMRSNASIFPQLQSLQIRYGFIRDSLVDNLEVFNFNMVTIMKSFYCPRLTKLAIRPDPCVLEIMAKDPDWLDEEHIEWENSPLKAFVHVHRATLKVLDLFLYARELDEDRYDYYEYPLELTEYVVVVPFLRIAKEYIGRYYWKSTAQLCTDLRKLILQVEFWHNYSDFFDVAPGILAHSASTLTFIRLESFALEEEDVRERAHYRRNSVGLAIRFGIFAVCTKLKVLEVCQLSPKKNYVAVDLANLPLTLERLEIKLIYVPSDEVYELGGLKSLRHLSLYQVGTSGIFGVNFKGLKAICGGCSSLERFLVTGLNFEDSEKRLRRIVKEAGKSSNKESLLVHSKDKETIVFQGDMIKMVLK